jgi:hypothetical protein
MRVNFGLRPFVYDSGANSLRTLLPGAAGGNPPPTVGALRPGIGVNERPLR